MLKMYVTLDVKNNMILLAAGDILLTSLRKVNFDIIGIQVYEKYFYGQNNSSKV